MAVHVIMSYKPLVASLFPDARAAPPPAPAPTPTPAQKTAAQNIFVAQWMQINIILEQIAIVLSTMIIVLIFFFAFSVFMHYFDTFYAVATTAATPFDSPGGENFRSELIATLKRIEQSHALSWRDRTDMAFLQRKILRLNGDASPVTSLPVPLHG